jgi:acetyl esterase
VIHPQVQALLNLLKERKVPSLHTVEPAEARRLYKERAELTQPTKPQLKNIRELSCDGPHGPIGLRLYKPDNAPNDKKLPLLMYYHGGGWVIGDLDTHDTFCRQLAAKANCAVLSVDYRMGPEHRFPCAVDDCIAATRFASHASDLLGIDAEKIAVGGDSAGGNLAAVVALYARDNPEFKVMYQLLVYPATDMRMGHDSHVRNGKDYVLTADMMKYFHDHYMDDNTHDHDWRASPAMHTNHANLPPALVLTAGYDPLVDEGLEYAQKLTMAGNDCTYICFERQIHGFILMGGVINESNQAVNFCASALKTAFESV